MTSTACVDLSPPGTRRRHSLDQQLLGCDMTPCRRHNPVECAFARLKGVRPIAACYDKLASDFLV
jgi:hypothetical protein